MALLAHSTVCAARIRDAPPGHAFRGETLQRCRPGRAGLERGSTASKWTKWISIPPPFVTGSCRGVDLDPAAKWICLSPPLKVRWTRVGADACLLDSILAADVYAGGQGTVTRWDRASRGARGQVLPDRGAPAG